MSNIIKIFFKSILSPLVLLFTLSVTLFIAAYFFYEPNLPRTEQLRNTQLQLPIQVYSKENQLIAEFGQFRRRPVTIDEVPKDMINAFVSIEDARYWEHAGVDFRGIARAVVKALRTGSVSEGASTITMQLARNLFLTSEKTADRKLREMFLAFKIEKEFSKEEILELYVNKIFLGNRAYGVGSAAEIYYGKKLSELSLAQMAMIAGLPKAPSRYNPIRQPTRAKQRRDYILKRMYELDYITQDQYTTAKNESVSAKVYQVESETYAPYIAEMARAEAEERYGVENMYTLGLKIYTTLDSRQQDIALKTVRKHLISYSRRHGYRGPIAKLDLNKFNTPESLEKQLQSYNNYQDLIPAVVLESNEESATLVRRGSTTPLTLDLDAVKWARTYQSNNRRGPTIKKVSSVLSKGDAVWVSQNSDSEWELTQLPKVTGALTVVDPKDGAIEAMVGGFDFTYSKFNRAVQAKRQPGSSFKPFIYSAALATGKYSPGSVVEDEEIVIPGSTWSPQNYDKKYHGPTLLREALRKSRNIVSIKLLQQIGLAQATSYAQRFGFDEKAIPQDLTLSLGSGSVTPLDLATAYASFANGGFKVDNYYIREIKDKDDRILFEHKPATVCTQCPIPALTELEAPNMPTSINGNPVAKRIIEPYVHYQITSMLRDVARSGTAAKASRILQRTDLAGKTGTTNDQRDSWFAGFTPKKVTTVWMGFDNLAPLGRGETATRAALPLWIDFMKGALEGTESAAWAPPPKGMLNITIDARNGFPPSELTLDTINELVIASQIPTEEDLALYKELHPEEFLITVVDLAQQRQNDRLRAEYQQQIDNYNRRVAAREQEVARLQSIGSTFVPAQLAPPPEPPEELAKLFEAERIRAERLTKANGGVPVTTTGNTAVTPTTPLTEDQELMRMINELNLE
ncbi:penicillin-binding protein 1A [Leucothrix arctica]|uniref:Penicillin-binding protein 1A n=1 Tax=Leucothrix arctica TaxID=1481894 RepID=A0A317CIZ1_9GAMM|nr:penicillin-binding protein 1A [Leucothrix arctica]PWQ98524.1 penicillin-binding protein 1A [Leucothrix arctica]